jgi:L-methionine (R)-S-oxide reductase
MPPKKVKVLPRKELYEIRANLGHWMEEMRSIHSLYDYAVDLLHYRIPSYQSVSVYLTNRRQFELISHAGKSYHPLVVPFGVGRLSITAAKGRMSFECFQDRKEVFVPFYCGHHLIGELVVVGHGDAEINREDLDFLQGITELFENVICN